MDERRRRRNGAGGIGTERGQHSISCRGSCPRSARRGRPGLSAVLSQHGVHRSMKSVGPSVCWTGGHRALRPTRPAHLVDEPGAGSGSGGTGATTAAGSTWTPGPSWRQEGPGARKVPGPGTFNRRVLVQERSWFWSRNFQAPGSGPGPGTFLVLVQESF